MKQPARSRRDNHASRPLWTDKPADRYIGVMRKVAASWSLMPLRRSRPRLLRSILPILLALSFIVSLVSVHAALAEAETGGQHSPVISVPDTGQSDEAPGLAQSAHLAGHLTCVLEPALLDTLAQDAVAEPKRIHADLFPLSSFLPTPSEPPRA